MARALTNYEIKLKNIVNSINHGQLDIEGDVELEEQRLKYIEFLDICIKEYLSARSHNSDIIRSIYNLFDDKEKLLDQIKKDMIGEINSINRDDIKLIDFNYFDELFLTKTIDYLLSFDVLLGDTNKSFSKFKGYLRSKCDINKGSIDLLNNLIKAVTENKNANDPDYPPTVEKFKDSGKITRVLDIVNSLSMGTEDPYQGRPYQGEDRGKAAAPIR